MRSTIRVFAAAILASLVPSVTCADVTITWRRVTGGPAGEELKVVETIDGMKQREDEFREGVMKFSALRDLQANREVLLWHEFKLRQTLPFDPHTVKKAVREEAVERRLQSAKGKPTGRVETILGVRCREFSYVAVAYDSKFVVKGTYWLAEKGSGDAEYAAFYARMSAFDVEKEPGISKGNRARLRGRLELRREFLAAARRDGVPYRMEYEVSGSGVAPIRVTQEAVAVSTADVKADVFEMPAGYRVR